MTVTTDRIRSQAGLQWLNTKKQALIVTYDFVDTSTGSTRLLDSTPMIQRLTNICSWFLRDEEAATAVEYALLLAMIAIFSIGAILQTGDVQQALWFDTADDIQVIAP